jgi:hypothetical protein
MTVPDNTVSSISKLGALHLGKKCLGFELDNLREQLFRTRSQDIGQGSSISSDDEDVQHCYSHSWRIALLERFRQARHPPRYAA